MSVEIVYEIAWYQKIQLDGSICDYCGEELEEFPCAVIMEEEGENPHALCKDCRLDSAINPGDNQYFESLAFQEKKELGMPGKNFGGRRV